MVEPGDPFLSFMRGPEPGDDQLPRLGIWQAGQHATPRPIDLNDAGRDWIAGIGLPAVFRRRGTTTRTEQDIRAGMNARVEVSGPDLDTLMAHNAERHSRPSGKGSRRTRGKDNAIKASAEAGYSLESHLDTRHATQGQWALDDVRTDVDLLLTASDTGSWDEARRILEVVVTPRWGGEVADVDISGVEVPTDHITDPTAIRMLDAAIAAAQRSPLPQRKTARGRFRAMLLVTVLLAIAAVLTIIAVGSGGPTLSKHNQVLRASGKVLIVSNLVTSGMHMTEDRYPAVLTGRPVPICCTVQGSERRTGQRYDAAVCQTTGPYDTNGNDESSADNRNPHLAQSHLYYGVLLANGRFGFTSDVWVEKSQRGGLGLPHCAGERPLP